MLTCSVCLLQLWLDSSERIVHASDEIPKFCLTFHILLCDKHKKRFRFYFCCMLSFGVWLVKIIAIVGWKAYWVYEVAKGG